VRKCVYDAGSARKNKNARQSCGERRHLFSTQYSSRLENIVKCYFELFLKRSRRSCGHKLIHRVSPDSRPHSCNNPVEIGDGFVSGCLALNIFKRSRELLKCIDNFCKGLIVSQTSEFVPSCLFSQLVHLVVGQVQHESICRQEIVDSHDRRSLVAVAKWMIRNKRPKKRSGLGGNSDVRIFTERGCKGLSHRRLKKVQTSDIMRSDGLVPYPFDGNYVVMEIFRVARPKSAEPSFIRGQGDSMRSSTSPRRTRMWGPVSFRPREVCAE
jgi:hypothetical protein